MTREPLPDGAPDRSCPDCGGPTENLVGGARCSANDPCGWHERWSAEAALLAFGTAQSDAIARAA